MGPASVKRGLGAPEQSDAKSLAPNRRGGDLQARVIQPMGQEYHGDMPIAHQKGSFHGDKKMGRVTGGPENDMPMGQAKTKHSFPPKPFSPNGKRRI